MCVCVCDGNKSISLSRLEKNNSRPNTSGIYLLLILDIINYSRRKFEEIQGMDWRTFVKIQSQIINYIN